MLELDNLKFAYAGAEIGANFQLPRGRSAVLMAPSGAGKSTLLNLIAGLLTPQRGQVRFDGRSLRDLAPNARPLSYLLQAHNLFPHLTVRQNVGIGLHPGLRLSKSQWARVAQALEWVDLRSFAERVPPSLSGGQQQRVALARCLARAQPLLLLDEPFSGLDAGLRRDLLGHLQNLQQHRTSILLATHQAKDAEVLDAATIPLTQNQARNRSFFGS